MQFIPETTILKDYLETTNLIDFQHPAIQDILTNFDFQHVNKIEQAKMLYEYVRDNISHAWDIQSPIVTRTASEVAIKGTGICYAKSNLLAALLRSCGIPSGFCYQRLMLFDSPEKGFCLHAFNAAYLESLNKWIVLDARGNKPGVNAQFSLSNPKLAFSTNEAFGEVTYSTIFHEPNEKTMHALVHANNCIEMYKLQLPDQL